MNDAAGAILGPWSNFFVIAGSAAAALTGLMFVVVTLISNDARRRSPDGVHTYSSPTVAHFAAALFVAAMLSMPWRTMLGPEVLLAAAGLGGIAYLARVIQRARKLTHEYTPDVEDRLWYSAFPLVAYGALAVAAVLLVVVPGDALFAVALGVLLLTFIGIHNSWDVVTYLATNPSDPD
jgi:hypothetical protein